LLCVKNKEIDNFSKKDFSKNDANKLYNYLSEEKEILETILRTISKTA